MAERNYRKGGRRNWRIRFIDETEYYDQEAVLDKLPAGCKIISAYAFDPGVVTHICSTSGSQWHVGLATFIVPPDYQTWQDWFNSDPVSAEREALRDEIEAAAPESNYFGDKGEADSVDSGLPVLRKSRKGETNDDDIAEAYAGNESHLWAMYEDMQDKAKAA